MNVWRAPRWVQSGWLHAERILADATDGAEATHRTEVMSPRLETGDYRDAVERVNLERELVAELSGGWRQRVAGYTVKRQYFSAAFTHGLANIGFGSLAGVNSQIFIRTVESKDLSPSCCLMLGIDA